MGQHLRFSAALILLGQLVQAAEIPAEDAPKDQSTMITESVQSNADRMQLTAEQSAQLKLILQDNAQQVRTVMKQHGVKGGGELTDSQKRALAQELQPIKQATDARVKALLSDEQFKEFNAIRKEAREKAMARRKNQSG